MKSFVKSVAKTILPAPLQDKIRARIHRDWAYKHSLRATFSALSKYLSYYYEPVSINGQIYQANREWEERWKHIKSQLEYYEAGSVLDIGCAEGWFLRRAAEEHGCFALGIEYSKRMLVSEVARLHDDVSRVAIMKDKVGPEDIVKLPVCDVVLCLSVVHHIIAAEGIEAAKEFIRAIAKITNKAIIFEIGAAVEQAIWKDTPLDVPQSQTELTTDLLQSSGFKNIRDMGATPSMVDPNVMRHLFVAEPDR